MLANLNRDSFIALLEKLRSEDDEEVLTSARDINAQMTVAEVNWDDLLIPEGGSRDDPEEEPEDQDDDIADTESSDDLDSGPLSEEEKKEALSTIDTLLGMEISDATREEVKDYKQDIADGEFEQMDLRYLRALLARLS